MPDNPFTVELKRGTMGKWLVCISTEGWSTTKHFDNRWDAALYAQDQALIYKATLKISPNVPGLT